MDELLKFCESEAARIDHEMSQSYDQFSGSEYQSVIKFDGHSILPPLMTSEVLEEMRMYKHQAIMIETRLRARIRQKLLEKVQAVMQRIEAKERYSECSRSTDEQDLQSVEVSPSDLELQAQDGQTEDQAASVVHPHTFIPQFIVPNQSDSDAENLNNSQENQVDSENEVDSICSGQTSGSNVVAQKLQASCHEKFNFAVPERQASGLIQPNNIPELVKLVDDLDIVSPRTITRDSGISSESRTLIASGGESTIQGSIDVDESNTVAEFTDLDDVESNDEVDLEITTMHVEHTEHGKVASEENITSDSSSSDIVFNDESDKENVERTESPKSDFSDKLTNSQSFSGTLPGSKERVEMLVRKLDFALKYHEKQRAMVYQGRNLQSTNSSTVSCATASSDEMNQTVIAVDKVIGSETMNNASESDLVNVTGKMLKLRTRKDTTETEETNSTLEISVLDQTDMDEKSSAQCQGQISKPISVNAAKSEEDPSKLRTSLLSRVVFDTPDETSEDLSEQDIPHNDDVYDDDQLISSMQTVLEVPVASPSPGPVETPDVFEISNITDEKKSMATQEAFQISSIIEDNNSMLSPISAAVKLGGNIHRLKHSTDLSLKSTKYGSPKEVAKPLSTDPFVNSSSISHHQTASTELAQYMDQSHDTLPSSLTTLPYVPENNLKNLSGATESPSGSSLPVDSQPSSQERAQKGTERPIVLRVRQNSYTLEHPSPVLVAAHGKSRQSPAAASKSKSVAQNSKLEGKPFNLTSSMEDLRLKPGVQRKLDYENNAEQLKPILKKRTPENSPKSLPIMGMDDQQGKEEHLQRYLEHLSQMPAFDGQCESYDEPSNMKVQFVQQMMPNVPKMGTDNSLGSMTLPGHTTSSQTLPLTSEKPLVKGGNQSLPIDLANVGPMSQEDMMQLQMQYFEIMRQQLMEQQQRQLAELFAEQERQQLLLQQELLQHQQWGANRTAEKSLRLKQSPVQKTNRHMRQDSKKRRNVQEIYQSQQMQQYSQEFSSDQQFVVPHSHEFYASNNNDGVNMDQSYRSTSAPAARVSFAPNPRHSLVQNVSPSGVYCNQNFPISSHDGSFLDTSLSHGHNNGINDSYRSPAVLQYSVPNKPNTDAHLVTNTDNNGQNLKHTQSQPDHNGQNMHYNGQQAYDHSYSQGAYFATNQAVYDVNNGQLGYLQQHSAQSDGQYGYSNPSQQYFSSLMPAGYGHQPRLPSKQDFPPSLQTKFAKVTATVKGHLTRKLMKTDKVQQLINTIKDTAEFALDFQQETPIKKGIYSHQDRILQDRVLAQLTAAMYEIHEVFFETTPKERMAHIQQSRMNEQEKMFKQVHETAQSKKISSATKKAIERKKRAKAAEAIVFAMARPKSCPPNTSSPKPSRAMDLRALKPIQAQISPIKPDADTSRSLPIEKKQYSPRSKAAVKRIQFRPKSATGKVSKRSCGTAGRKVSRPSEQANNNSPGTGDRNSPATEPSSSPLSHTDNHPSSKRTTSQPPNRPHSEASNRQISRHTQKFMDQVTSRIDNKWSSTNDQTTSSGIRPAVAKGKSSQMVRHISHSNKARLLTEGADSNARTAVHQVVATNNHIS